MPRCCAARKSSTVSVGGARQSLASVSGRMPRKVTPGACCRYAASFGASPWLAGSRARSAINASSRRWPAGVAASCALAPRILILHVCRGGQFLDGRDAFVELAVQLAGKPCQKSQRAGAFDLGCENQPAAGAFGIEFGVELEVPKRAVLELALLAEPAVFLPFAEPLVPLQSQGTGLGGRGPPRAAIGVEPIRHLIGRRASHFVEPRGIGEERPDRFGRLRETRFLAVAIDRCHAHSRRRWRIVAITNTSNVLEGFAAIRCGQPAVQPRAVWPNFPNKHQFAVRAPTRALTAPRLEGMGAQTYLPHAPRHCARHRNGK